MKVRAATTLPFASGQTNPRRVTKAPGNVETKAAAKAGVALCKGSEGVGVNIEAGAVVRNRQTAAFEINHQLSGANMLKAIPDQIVEHEL